MLLRSPCKNLKPYDNPFCDFSNGGAKKKNNNKRKILITKNIGLPKFAPLVARTSLGLKYDWVRHVLIETDQEIQGEE